MQWDHSKNGTQLGPLEESELRAKLASGEISAADLVWRDGMPDWLAASKVGEFAALTVKPAVTMSAPPASGGVVNSPYAPPASLPSTVAYAPNIPNYLWQSIVVTLFCCLPFGIPAIVYAAKVDTLKAQGNIPAAMAASNSAKTWCMVSGGIGLCVFALWVIGAVFAGVSGVSLPIDRPMRRDRAMWVILGILALAGAAFLLRQVGPNGIPWFPGCTFHRLTGLNCPGCGMTRAAHATLHGRIGEAFRFNPVGMVLLPLALAGVGIEVVGWVRGKPLPFRLNVGAVGAWAIVCLVIGFWVFRNLPWWPFTLLAPP